MGYRNRFTLCDLLGRGYDAENFTSNELTGEPANMSIHILFLFTFVAVFLYDAIYKSSLASNVRAVTILSFLLLTGYIFAYAKIRRFGYRALIFT